MFNQKIKMMKKLAYVLGFLFVAGMGMTTYASTVIVKNDINITVVDQNDDEKPCPKGCTCEKCKKADAKCKTDCKNAKADCKHDAKCDKAVKSCCKNSKSAVKTDDKTKTTTTPTKK